MSEQPSTKLSCSSVPEVSSSCSLIRTKDIFLLLVYVLLYQTKPCSRFITDRCVLLVASWEFLMVSCIQYTFLKMSTKPGVPNLRTTTDC